MVPNNQGILDDQIDPYHVCQHGVFLTAQDVIDLLVDLLEVLDDLIHLLLHSSLLHHCGQCGEGKRTAQQRGQALEACDRQDRWGFPRNG